MTLTKHHRMVRTVAGAAVAALALTACGGDPTESDSGSITVGSAAFNENEIIAEIYAQALEAEGVEVERQMQIGAREAYIPALENGEIDLIPEYTGNLLLHFDPESEAATPQEVDEALDAALPEALETLEEAPAENKDSYNVTRELAETEGLTTIGDLAKIDGLKVGGNPEFETRSYGIPGLTGIYGVDDPQFVSISDSGGPATVKALVDGDVDVANIYSTTPAIVANDLVTLEDPENMIAAQNVVPLINEDKATDEVEDVLERTSEALTTEDLLALNDRVDGDEKAATATVAKEWLEEKDLI
ncbi:ABC transporter substrate-binding protein [Aeromicrobium sp. CTD01-1L150]|uniref:ABC transporter substrate-binding protein n=1 Tax=Aeromicrobium sp. CTD01-1L150 TaxID=3341830 RepID=UPI0035BF2AFE